MVFDVGFEVVMIVFVYYLKIDFGIFGLFLLKIMIDMLCGDFGYQGFIVFDDLGSLVLVFLVDGGYWVSKFVFVGGDLVIIVDFFLVGFMICVLMLIVMFVFGKKCFVDVVSYVINVKLVYLLMK